MISLGEHQAIFGLGPLWIGFLSYYVLKEKYLNIDKFCAILGFIGLILIVRPKFIWNLFS